MKRNYKKIFVFLCIVLCIGNVRSMVASAKKMMGKQKTKVVVIDPGHGGTDSGKIGVNQCMEKDINLEIAKKLKKRLKKEKIKVLMTRENDQTEEHKIEDMEKRVRLINEAQANLAISIHQNSYTQEEIQGAQVFYYGGSKKGEEMAEIMQETFRLSDPTNRRMAQENQSYYILKKTKIPTIIVECGFLSNWEEAEKLKSEEYQERIAQILCDGIVKILEQEM